MRPGDGPQHPYVPSEWLEIFRVDAYCCGYRVHEVVSETIVPRHVRIFESKFSTGPIFPA